MNPVDQQHAEDPEPGGPATHEPLSAPLLASDVYQCDCDGSGGPLPDGPYIIGMDAVKPEYGGMF